MPHIPDLGLKQDKPPADAVKRPDLRAAHPVMYGFGRRFGWIIVLIVIALCVVLSLAVLTVFAHLYWRLIDAVWRVT